MKSFSRKSIPIVLLIAALSLLCLNGMPVLAQMSPNDSLKSLRAADGINIALWASEPMVNNPTAMDIDSRGRVWIAEGLNYRMKMKEFDSLKRVADADRIKILEDTNGDGRADKVTVFADNIFPVPLGLAVEEIWRNGQQIGTRVYVGNSPDLLVFEDTNGDDVADQRHALLTGFRGIDSDHGLHGTSLGPDGKLYFTVGDARYGADNVQSRQPTFDVTDQSGRQLSADNFGTTLRVNRDGTLLEVLTSGHRNNYEAAVDSFGNVFGSDNDDDGNRGCRMYWVMEGGRYGYQHPSSARHWAEEIPGIIPKLVGTGNGAPSGLTVYEGDLLPPEYFGAVLQVDAGSHHINAHRLVRSEGGFRADYRILLKGEDDWFRPIDVSVAPDGSLFVCDWYDAGVGGNRFTDQTTGRIYRLSSLDQGATKFQPKPATDPTGALQSPNRCAQLAGHDRLVQQGSSAREPLLQLWNQGRPHARARALHVLFQLAGTGISDALAALTDADPRMRETALQLLIRDAAAEFLVDPSSSLTVEVPALTHLDTVLPLAQDADAGVRRALLLGLRRAPTAKVDSALIALAKSWDGQDRFYLEAIRAAIAHREAEFVSTLFQELNADVNSREGKDRVAQPPYYPISGNDAFPSTELKLPPANAASRFIGIAWALQRPEAIPAVRAVLSQNSSTDLMQAAIEALCGISEPDAAGLLLEVFESPHADLFIRQQILQKIAGQLMTRWPALRDSQVLTQVLQAAWETPELRLDAIQAMAKLGLKKFSSDMRSLVLNQEADVTERAAALKGLGDLGDSHADEIASQLVEQSAGQASGGVLVIAALESLQSLGGTKQLLQVVVDSKLPLDARRRALQLVAMQYAGVELVVNVRESGVFSDELEMELNFLLRNHSDRRVRQLAEKHLPQSASADSAIIHDYQTLMSLTGDAARGQVLFDKHPSTLCARCHRVDGQGVLVGPDLSTIGTKYGPKELLYHLQNPSGAINYNFAAHTFLLDDGSVINGLIVKRDGQAITLGLANGEQTTIASTTIEEEKASSVSLMPAGLLTSLSPQQVADLLEYLLTLRQSAPGQSGP
jgi:putative membrane-bound dehydrogenase-like protein